MSFVIKAKKTYTWPVKLKAPGDGKYEEQELALEFKKLDSDEFTKLVDSNPTDLDVVKKVVVGWKDVKTEAGEAFPFNDENLSEILKTFGFAAQIARQYLDSVTGVVIKN